jgi:hypothetical protein
MSVNSRSTCVRCNRVHETEVKRCQTCGCIAFVKGHPLTWWPLRFEDGQARFLFPKFDAAAPRLDLDYTPKPMLRPAVSR